MEEKNIKKCVFCIDLPEKIHSAKIFLLFFVNP